MSANTRASYASAMRYWTAWFELRFGQELDQQLPVAPAGQFSGAPATSRHPRHIGALSFIDVGDQGLPNERSRT